MTAPPVAEATHTSQPVVVTGGQGFKQRILTYCAEAGIEMSGSKARRLGERMWRRAERQQEEFDFFAALRILGIQSDPTARTAVHKAECERAECGTCGRTRGER